MNAVAYVLWHGSAPLVGSEDDAILVLPVSGAWYSMSSRTE